MERGQATSKKQTFYQKLEKLQINTRLKGFLKWKNNQQKTKILPEARKNSHQYLFKRNIKES